VIEVRLKLFSETADIQPHVLRFEPAVEAERFWPADAPRSPRRREVVTLRDVNGGSAEEVCNVLQISQTNQRVLLHRGRSRMRRALELYLTGT